MLHICNNELGRFEVRYYATRSGRIPFVGWLNKLKDATARVRIRIGINRLRCGFFGDTKFIESGVEELRLHFGPGYRIYYGRPEKGVVLVLCGGMKGSQRRDIIRARGYWVDYLEASYGKEKTLR